MSRNQALVTNFINAFNDHDFKKLASFIDEHITSYITNAQAQVDKEVGRDAFMKRMAPMETTSVVSAKIRITQILSPNPNQVLLMVEVKAERPDGKKLHNHAAFLLTIKNDKISEFWMVEALPAYSDEFWKH